MHRLIIAEKPSVANAIADLLGVTEKGRGYLICGDTAVSSCFGHLFELPYPEYYNPDFKRWTFANMPIVPPFVMLPKDSARDRIKLLGQLMKDADEVVNAGDPDNEGQLLVDTVIEHFKFRKRVLRFWSSAQDPASLHAAMQNLQDNRQFHSMGHAARARSQADYLIGINLSRAYTLRAQAFGRQGVIPVGRVQTPTLAMVVRRDAEIANFRPTNYHHIDADVEHQSGGFRMRWQPQEGQPGCDSEGRLIDTAIADAIVARLHGVPGSICEVETKEKTENQPKGLSLAGIGLLASKMFNFTAAQTLQICQSLYETHKLTSYPRTDSEYLPDLQHGDAPQVLAAVRENLPEIAAWIDAADPAIKSRTWDSSKAQIHHGIIPTAMRADTSRLHPHELALYQLIVRQYIAQFFPAHSYLETVILADAGGERFAARGKVITEAGWKQLYQESAEGEGEAASDQHLPTVSVGDALSFTAFLRRDLRTKAPKPFTEGTLPPATENIYRFMENEEDRASLKEGDGIGTPATRGAIIEELKKRGFLVNSGKWLVSTENGRLVLTLLPPEVQSPALTASFQRQLKDIEQGARTIEQFVGEQVGFITSLVDLAKSDLPVEEHHACPACEGAMRRVRRKDGSGHFWSCSHWKEGCKSTADDKDGKPVYRTAA